MIISLAPKLHGLDPKHTDRFLRRVAWSLSCRNDKYLKTNHLAQDLSHTPLRI